MATVTVSGMITKHSIAGDGSVEFTVQPEGGPPAPDPIRFKPGHVKQEKLIEHGQSVTVTCDDAEAAAPPYTANLVARP